MIYAEKISRADNSQIGLPVLPIGAANSDTIREQARSWALRVDVPSNKRLPPALSMAYLFFVRPMKSTLRSTFVAIIFSTMLLSFGCQKKTAATDPTGQSTPGSTKALEAADLVGYDGKRLRKSVDRIREGNEKHNQELEKTTEDAPDQ